MERITVANETSQETQIVNAVKSLSKQLRKIKHKDTGTTTTLSAGAKRKLAEIVKHVDNSLKEGPLGWIPAKEKFFTTIGIEYTFLKRKQSKVTEDEIVKKIIKLSDKRQKWNKNVHQDGRNVIEFASPVHHDWEDLLKTYRKTVAIAKKVSLVTKRHDEGSGGGHIHMGIPKHWNTKFRLKFLKILYLDLSSRPYINWIFNEPIDDKNASSLLTQREGVRFASHLSKSSFINLNKLDNFSGKSYCVRYDEEYDTVEFRGFDMVESEQMLEEYIEFINAYFRYIYNVAKNNFYSTDFGVSYYNINKTSLDRYRDKKFVVSEFGRLLKELGLNPVKYRKYISKNYDVRIKLSQRGDIKMDYDQMAEIDFSNINKRDYDYEDEECEYDNRRTSSEGYPDVNGNYRDANGNIIPTENNLEAVMDADGQLHFVRKKKPKDLIQNESTTNSHGFTIRGRSVESGFGEPISGTPEDISVVPDTDFEEIDIEEIEQPRSAIVADESIENVCKFVLGPGESKTILGVPVSNSSSDKYLIVTKNADDSLTFKYFEKEVEPASIGSELSMNASDEDVNRTFELMTTNEAVESENTIHSTRNLRERINDVFGSANIQGNDALNSLLERSLGNSSL